MIKKLILLLLLSVASCKSQNVNLDKYKKNKDKVIWSILFTDGFKNDYADLLLNDQKIIKNGYLNSDESDGVTSVWFRITKEKKGYYLWTSQEKTLKAINLKRDEIIINVVYKGEDKKIELKRDNGKFVLISKNLGDELVISQRKTHLQFD
mgnify:CR=1 FL=1